MLGFRFASVAGLIGMAALGGLSACATAPKAGPGAPGVPETIAVSVGPCFGFCPVYKLGITPNGAVAFDGERHTAVLGQRTREAGRATYDRTATALAPYRPTTGATAETTCETRISDQQHYTVSWTAADGTVTTLNHDRGCRSARNEALNEILQALPSQLGIEPWTRQTTRPGASRG